MPSLRLESIAQAVFPNQRNDEKIFTIERRHYVSYLINCILVAFLFLVPLVIIIVATSSIAFLFQPQNLILRDVVILVALVYYLLVSFFFMTTWVMYYYNIFILTDARVIEITQHGLFNRAVYELVFEQVEDVSYRTKGILQSLFDVGDLEIQTAGSQRYFTIKSIPRPHDCVSIIDELTLQAKRGIDHRERIPDLPVIGIINGILVHRNGHKPPIMNIEMNLKDMIIETGKHIGAPRTVREKIDRWWWNQKNQMSISFGSEDDDLPLKNTMIFKNKRSPKTVTSKPPSKPKDAKDDLLPIDEIK